MVWTDHLIPASYRGVEFLVDSHEWSSGRHASIVEFPQRESVYVEDLGRKATLHRLNVLLVGDDYPSRRDRLFKVLAARSNGWPYRPGSLLRHPYLGELNVLPLSWRVTETRREGRLCRVSIEFVEAGGPPTPIKSKDALASADAAAEELELAAEAASAELDVAGPNSLADSFAEGLRDVGRKIRTLDVFTGPAEEVATLALDVARLIDTASSLATSPADAVATVRSAVSTIFAAASNFAGALTAYEGLLGYSTSRDGGSSSTSVQLDANAARLESIVRDFSISGATRSAVRAPFAFLAEAEATRGRILDQVDELLEETDDRIVDALETVRVVLANQVPRSPATLPNLRALELPEELPSLVLAFRLYRNPDRGDEIAIRNATPLPGFLPALVPLEVLSS